MKEFIQLAIGDATVPQFVVALLYAYVTAFAKFMYRIANRKSSTVMFSWRYFLSNNATRVCANLIFIFLGVRFAQTLIGAENTAYAGLMIGLASDTLAKRFEDMFSVPKKV